MKKDRQMVAICGRFPENNDICFSRHNYRSFVTFFSILNQIDFTINRAVVKQAKKNTVNSLI
jgi:hypothetical protein